MLKTHFSAANTARGIIDRASELSRCSQCGFCLAKCPTYLQTRDEMMSPRGRVYLMATFGQSSALAIDALESCLRCGQCEAPCPTGVPYAALIRDYCLSELSHPLDEWAARAHTEMARSDVDQGAALLYAAMLYHALPTAPKDTSGPLQAFSILPRGRMEAGGGDAVLLVAGPVLRVLRPDLVAAIADSLVRAKRRVVQFPDRERIALPWMESGLRPQFDDAVLEYRSNLAEVGDGCTVVVLDPYTDQILRSRLLPGLAAEMSARLQSFFEMGLRPRSAVSGRRLCADVTTVNKPWNRHVADVVAAIAPDSRELPAPLAAASAMPVPDTRSYRFLAPLVGQKRRWLAENVDSLVTCDPLSLARYADALHVLDIMGATDE